jgi:predicted secreted protein
MVMAALTLHLLGAILSVKDGGIEDYLNLADVAAIAKYEAALEGLRAWIPGVYLGVDSALFVPLYSLFTLFVVKGLLGAPEPSRFVAALKLAIVAGIASLTTVDVIENVSGAFRVSWRNGVIAGCGLLVGIVLALRLRKQPIVDSALEWAFGKTNRKCTLAVSLAVTFGTFALGVAFAYADTKGTSAVFYAVLVSGIHRAKVILLGVVVGALALGCVLWTLGLDPELLTQDPVARDAAVRARAGLRAAIADMLGRSRYVLVALALIAALTLAMDQARDIAYAMAAPLPGNTAGQSIGFWCGSLGSFVLLALAAGSLDFSCWLWTRSACQLMPLGLQRRQEAQTMMVAALADTPEPSGSADSTAAALEAAIETNSFALPDTFAKYWARALAFAPIAILIFLYARVIGETVLGPSTVGITVAMPVARLLIAGGFALATGAFLIRWQSKQSGDPALGYYSSLTWRRWEELVAFMRPKQERSKQGAKYRPWVRPQNLPLALLVGAFALRVLDILPSSGQGTDYWPTMTLPVAFLSVAFWLCLFGWLSILEVYQSVPWIALFVVLVIALGSFGLTDNHRVWSTIEDGSSSPWSNLRLLIASGAVAAVLLGTYYVGLGFAARWSSTRASLRMKFVLSGASLVAFLVLESIVLRVSDSHLTSRSLAAESSPPKRATLDHALAQWLTRLYETEKRSSDATNRTLREVPVYFVSTEGGGIRAAAWTAFTLNHFAETEENFTARTFSISGVSGGAVGAAAFRACDPQAGTAPESRDVLRRACVERFTKTDMVSPLISAWMFEDVMARVLPTRGCSTPGCGFLARGAWFEQTMEIAAPAFRKGLVNTGDAARAGGHFPYLLLNSTWIETGERAVASDLVIGWDAFPGAKDQLRIVDDDLPLGTAAHNAARFPYTNPIGSLHALNSLCPTAIKYIAEPKKGADDEVVLCGHLGDGGYFENGGAQSTIDVVRGFAACLGDATDPDAQSYPECQRIEQQQRQWLLRHLVPQVLMIRNDPKAGTDPPKSCVIPTQSTEQELTAPVADEQRLYCRKRRPTSPDYYTPEDPVRKDPMQALVGTLGPAIAVLQVSGIGSNGRLAEARQKGLIRALRGRMGYAASCTVRPPVRAVNLHDDGVLYPLGWHLSPVAVKGLDEQARHIDLGGQNTPFCPPR